MTEEQHATGAVFPHVISPYAKGETCNLRFAPEVHRPVLIRCGAPATHKVGEEDGDPTRHNLTAYVCCRHFGLIMGPLAQRICLHPPVEAPMD